MEIPTLVVSDPPHGEVNLEAASVLLELDVFAAGLKATFTAPEVMSASGLDQASEFATALGATGFNVRVLHGSALSALPWPDPVSTLAFDVSYLQVTIREEAVTIPYDTEIVGVYCRPPADRWPTPAAALDRAVDSGHGPTIAEAIQWTSILDLYFYDEGTLRRLSIVPDLLELDGERVVKDLVRRSKRLRLDSRLSGVRPRAAYVQREADVPGVKGPERRRYSFGTAMLRETLEAIAPELRAIPQYEFGSRLAYALRPLGAG